MHSRQKKKEKKRRTIELDSKWASWAYLFFDYYP